MEHFAQKVIGKQERTRKVVSHLVLEKNPKSVVSENRGNPCLLEVCGFVGVGGRHVVQNSRQRTEQGRKNSCVRCLPPVIIAAESVSKGQASFPSSPLVSVLFVCLFNTKGEERFLILTSGFGCVVLCFDSLEHKVDGCS